MVLHRNCNSIEGRVLHWARRSGIDPIEFLRNILEYVQRSWDGNPYHPNHKTEKEHELTKLRRKLRRAKTPRKKQQLRDAIRDLQK
jgi:hypothetical protein